MPPKNKIKIYAEDVFYHAYNRGYNRQEIFKDEQDYFTFIHLFKRYLEPNFQEIRFNRKGEEQPFTPNYVYNDVDLLAYCLMPNHFHLLIFQKTIKGMPKLVTRLTSNYSTYFNQKYQKEGSPFQDTYKAVAIQSEEQFINLSAYIHANPCQILTPGETLSNYPFSSLKFYAKNQGPKWLKMERISSYFQTAKSYEDFVETYAKFKLEEKSKDLEKIEDLTLE